MQQGPAAGKAIKVTMVTVFHQVITLDKHLPSQRNRRASMKLKSSKSTEKSAENAWMISRKRGVKGKKV